MVRKTRIRSIYRIPGGPDAVAKARQVAISALRDTDAPELIENVSLLLGEIMADRMSRNHTDPRLTIDVRHAGNHHRWCVVDRGTPTLPNGLRSTALDEIAEAWGVSRKAGLTLTWFQLNSGG